MLLKVNTRHKIFQMKGITRNLNTKNTANTMKASTVMPDRAQKSPSRGGAGINHS